MNLEFLKNEIIPQREKEILEGKNAATRQPIYVVYDVYESYTTYDGEYSNLDDINLFGYHAEHGKFACVDDDGNELDEDDENFDGDEKTFVECEYYNAEVTKFYVDRLVAFFLTRKGAEEYMKYQKHNLSSKAYIYTHYSGYSNQEMDMLLENK